MCGLRRRHHRRKSWGPLLAQDIPGRTGIITGMGGSISGSPDGGPAHRALMRTGWRGTGGRPRAAGPGCRATGAASAVRPHRVFRRASLHTGARLSVTGRVSDVHFGLATLHDLVGVTAGAKHRNDIIALSF